MDRQVFFGIPFFRTNTDVIAGFSGEFCPEENCVVRAQECDLWFSDSRLAAFSTGPSSTHRPPQKKLKMTRLDASKSPSAAHEPTSSDRPAQQTTTAAEESPSASSLRPKIAARFVTDAAELETLVPAWRTLADNCLLRNPCYEPEFLIPLIKHRSSEKDSGDAAHVLIVETVGVSSQPTQLLGLLPVVERPFYRLPVRCMHAWRPDEAFDATPLLCPNHSELALAAIFSALSDQGVRLLSMNTVSASDQLQKPLRSVAQSRSLPIFTRDCFERAAIETLGSGDEYLQQSMSKNRRKKSKQLLRRLEREGEVRFEHTDQNADFQAWAQDFVDLEASGWKGKNGSAIACSDNTLSFFLEMVDRFAARGAIRFGKLSLDTTPIAMLVDICSGSHVSGFKVAFDERFADFSPGFLLELQNIRWLHDLGCELCDSCTAPDNELINRLYSSRLPFQSIVVGLDPKMKACVSLALPSIQKAAQFTKSLRTRGS